MRVYLQSLQLGRAIAGELTQRGKTQSQAAVELNITQGQLSHLLSGHFKTKNRLVLHVCKYANINPNDFKLARQNSCNVDQEALDALVRVCGGQKSKTKAVIRVLRALETLSPAL